MNKEEAMKYELTEILKSEVAPATGCTGPTSVALAAALARSAVGGTPVSISIKVDKDTYKNSISVYIPKTRFKGVLEAAVLGAFYGNAGRGLEVLADMAEYEEMHIIEFAKCNATIGIDWSCKNIGVYIDATVETEKGRGRAVVAVAHDRAVLIEANDQVIYRDDKFSPDTDFEEEDPIRRYGVGDFFDYCTTIDIKELKFIKDALDMNMRLAEAGLGREETLSFGKGIENLPGNPMYIRAKAMAAAASDLRMDGTDLPAMSCAKSGNVGIAASVPLAVVAEACKADEEMLLRAVALSYLMTIYVKSHIGRLSAMCACAIAASAGVGSGAACLLTKESDAVEMTIKNIIGSIGGILCDGAKAGCALKLSSATGLAIESAQLAAQGICIPDDNGLVCRTADETIAMLGRIAKYGMGCTDEYMCHEIINYHNTDDSEKAVDNTI